jgi:hypothetical protein
MNRVTLALFLTVASLLFLLFTDAAKAQNPPVTNGLVVWLDASDLDGDGLIEGAGESGQTGGLAETWVDKAVGFVAGNPAENLTQAGGARPIYAAGTLPSGKFTVQFDGTDDSMQSLPFSTPLTQPNTIIAMYKFKAHPNQDRYVVDGLSTGRNAIWAGVSQGGGSPSWTFMWAGNFGMPDTTAVVTSPIVTGAVFNDTSSILYTNGMQKNSGFGIGSQSMTGITVGNRWGLISGLDLGLNGELAEVLVYDTALSAADISSVTSYLNGKWSVPEPSTGLLAIITTACISRIRRSIPRIR